jgi:hypothetical protein
MASARTVVNRQSRVTAQVGQQVADARVPSLACLGGVHRRRLDYINRLDFDHVDPGAVAAAGHDLAAPPAPEGQDDRTRVDPVPQSLLEPHIPRQY